ncbi:hypothetical protein IT774_06480 [Salinimonas marina]|uniref:Tail specific protease domain-containing protein n=1 Tax=Salinimonas marina TaxID=2785918 RepID=A0A7S9DZH1_9ALTE|nr:S41 family peptidase [Salinimonas marina]QPG06779.1 hypothetical protein IT774_06480 [Salinimonas marina]
MSIKGLFLAATTLGSFQTFADSVWTPVIQHDLTHIYTTVKDNHPEYVDTQNDYFRQWLEQGYQQGLKNAEAAESLNDAMTLISTYVAGFADGHFFLHLNYQPKTIKWAGIQIRRFGYDYRVDYTDSSFSASMPAHRARLVSCDGQLAEDIMNNEVLKARFNAPDLNSAKVRYAPMLLADDGLGQRTYFSHCRFEHNEKNRDYTLEWKTVLVSDYTQKTTSPFTPPDYSFTIVARDKYWITLPGFSPDNNEKDTLRSIFKKIAAVRTTASHFVVDVRGNGGGNSQWGVEAAKALYGDAFIEKYQQAHSDESYALWRVSNDNIQYLHNALPGIEEQFGKASEAYTAFTALVANMKRTLEQGDKLIRQGGETSSVQSASIKSSAEASSTLPAAATQAKILFVTDSRCGSACLDFVDLMLGLPNVVHVGHETSADTVYTDVRPGQLPSGLGRYSLAQKVYRDRPRKHNESYVPTHFYPGDIGNADRLKQWLFEEGVEPLQ